MKKTEESDGALTFSHKNIKKYICEWTSSHRTSLNTIRRLQTPGRARTPPHNHVGQKEKEKERDHDEACAQGESCEEERFLHPGKSPHWGGAQPGWRRSFGAQKETAATSLQKANWRVTCTEGQHPRPCAPQHEGCVRQCQWELNAEVQALEVRLGEKTGIGYTDTAQRGWTGATEDVLERSLGPPERQGAITGGQEGEGCDHRKNFFPYECSQTRGHHVQELPGQTQIAITIVGSRVSLGLPLQDP